MRVSGSRRNGTGYRLSLVELSQEQPVDPLQRRCLLRARLSSTSPARKQQQNVSGGDHRNSDFGRHKPFSSLIHTEEELRLHEDSFDVKGAAES